MFEIPKFIAALQQHPSAVHDLTSMTFWRYINGQFPKVIQWLFKYPELLRALAEDAEQHRRCVEQPAQEAA
jgi:hypothetical protein